MNPEQKIKVLVVDDEKHIRMLMRKVVRGLNLELAGEAENGKEAVQLFKQEKPDLVLLDINMPYMDGIEALKEIRGDTPNALVIMLTSVADTESVQKCIDLGAVDYILKSNPLQEIRQVIEESVKAIRDKSEASDARED